MNRPEPGGGPATRARILRAALQLIGERGVAGVTNRHLARVAGVSLGSITYHFATQTDLLRESLVQFVEDEVARLTDVAAELRSSQLSVDDAAQQIETIIRAAGADAQVAQQELYLAATRDPDLQAAADRCFAAYDEMAAAALGALGVPEPERLAPIVVAMVDGLELRRLTGAAGTPDVAEALRTFAALARTSA